MIVIISRLFLPSFPPTDVRPPPTKTFAEKNILFSCNSRLGIDLTSCFLLQFENTLISLLNDPPPIFPLMLTAHVGQACSNAEREIFHPGGQKVSTLSGGLAGAKRKLPNRRAAGDPEQRVCHGPLPQGREISLTQAEMQKTASIASVPI